MGLLDKVVGYIKQEVKLTKEYYQSNIDSKDDIDNELRSIEECCDPLKVIVTEAFDHSPIFVDEEMNEAALDVFESGNASVTMLQRRLKIPYSRGARLIDALEEKGIVGPFEGSTPRKILITKEQYLKRAKIIDDLSVVNEQTKVDIEKIIKEEQDWRRKQQGLQPIEYELQQIDNMDGRQFELWCEALLKQNGFEKTEVTQGSNDQGVDIIAVRDEIRYAIQCKCYSSDLGNTPVQEVHTGKAIYHCHVGVVMTNRYFTAGAKQAAEATGTLLWDRDKIKEMLNNAGQ